MTSGGKCAPLKLTAIVSLPHDESLLTGGGSYRKSLQIKIATKPLKELIVFALIYNLVRLVMAQAAQRQPVDIDRISFIDAARWLAAARDEEALPLLVINLHRPYRYEPRVRKRRPKQYPLMQTPRKELRKLLANNTDVD